MSAELKTQWSEEERLEDLQSYSILDTIGEEDFDNLTKIAASICNTPISLISLVDDKRQWFKSRYGLNEDETPREIAFCSHTIISNKQMMIVENAKADSRFQNNPLVTGEPHIGFYAGFSLISEKGFPLGTLCVIDRKPRKLSQSQKESLQALSRQVMNLMIMKKNQKELQAKIDQNKTLFKEIHHRVKNNMQVISGLLGLQATNTPYEEVKQLLRNSQHRINSMGLVHEMLYQSQDLAKINYGSYIENFVEKIINSFKGTENNIQFQLDADNIELNVDSSIPLGLIINEVVTNSLKYAFPQDQEGVIYVKLEKLDAPNFLLKIGDNGVGFDSQLSSPSGSSLGLKLIYKLTAQLNGIIEKDDSQQGTHYLIAFQEIQEF